jgi:hypothetical protein
MGARKVGKGGIERQLRKQAEVPDFRAMASSAGSNYERSKLVPSRSGMDRHIGRFGQINLSLR